MRHRKILVLIAVAIVLSSCRFQDNYAKTQSTEKVTLSPVSQAYDGVEELLGKDFGAFSLPENVTPENVQEAYRLSLSYRSIQEPQKDVSQQAKQQFQNFFGNNFKEENVTTANSACGELTYTYVDPETSDEGQFNGGFLAKRGNYVEPSGDIESCEAVEFLRGEDKNISLQGGSAKASELAEKANDYLRSNFSEQYGELDIKSKCVYFYNQPQPTAAVCCAQYFKGIPLEEYPSPLNIDNQDGTITYYFFNYIFCNFQNADSIDKLDISIAFDQIMETEKLDKIISLKQAVEILQTELAPESGYVFDDVQLLYCCKHTQKEANLDENGELPDWYEDYRKEPFVFTPTWCFFFNNEYSGLTREAVKVDAITGEITLDVA